MGGLDACLLGYDLGRNGHEGRADRHLRVRSGEGKDLIQVTKLLLIYHFIRPFS